MNAYVQDYKIGRIEGTLAQVMNAAYNWATHTGKKMFVRRIDDGVILGIVRTDGSFRMTTVHPAIANLEWAYCDCPANCGRKIKINEWNAGSRALGGQLRTEGGERFHRGPLQQSPSSEEKVVLSDPRKRSVVGKSNRERKATRRRRSV